ncbi:hypothetical protein DOY81_013054, partial [Sarcophaga bullata]
VLLRCLGLDCMAKDLRVTTDSSSQINNTRPLVSDTKTSHIDSSSASSVINSVSKKSHLLTTDVVSKDDKQQHIVAIGNNCDVDNVSSFKEHNSKYLDKNHTISVETRHGIIEYEGSPRRIGQMGNSNNDEHMPRVSNKLSQNHTITPNVNATATMAKTNNYAVNATSVATAATVVSAATTSTIATTNSPKQQQHYAARPGFPQRIISPQRESTPPIMLLNCNSKQQQLQQQQQQQQLNSQTLPQQSPTTDNNAESQDTSNDVSELVQYQI